MSFLTDPPALYANGKAYARLAPESAQGDVAKLAGAATVATFVGGSIAFYLDHPWTRPIIRALGYRSGREFMFGFPLPRRASRVLPDAVAVVAFATYPLWFWLGWDSGRRRRGRG